MDNDILVDITIDGKATGRFLIDTGSDFSCIDAAMAVRLGFDARKLHDLQNHLDPARPGVIGGFFHAKAVRLGATVLRDVYLLLIDTKRATGDVDYQGIIGMNILRKFAVLFDYPGHRMTLWSGGRLDMKTLRQVGVTDADSAVIKPGISFNVYTVHALLDGALDSDFLLDTGSAETTVTSTVASRLGLKSFVRFTTRYPLERDPEVQYDYGVARTFSIAGRTIANPLIAYGEKKFCVVGGDVLGGGLLLFDFPAGRMYLKASRQSRASLIWSPGKFSSPIVSAILADGKTHALIIDPLGDSCAGKDLLDSLKSAAAKASPRAAEADKPASSVLLAGTSVKPRSINFSEAKSVERLDGADGRLGLNFLRNFAVAIDFNRRRLVMISPGSLDGSNLQPRNAVRIPLMYGHGYCAVPLRVDGVPAMFALSLSHPVTTIVQRALVDKLRPTETVTAIRSIGTTRGITLNEIEIAGVVWRQPTVEDVTAVTEGPIGGVLGTDFLRQFRVTIDFPGRCMYLERDPDYKPVPVVKPRLGFQTGNLTSDGVLVVATIFVPSPAFEAGLKVGDRITEIDGVRLTAESLASLRETARISGRVIRFTVERAGKPQPFDIPITVPAAPP